MNGHVVFDGLTQPVSQLETAVPLVCDVNLDFVVNPQHHFSRGYYDFLTFVRPK